MSMSRRSLGLFALLALLLALPSIAVRFCTDDYAFRALLHRGAPLGRPWWDLFAFARGDGAEHELYLRAGVLPWWTAADFKLHFVRPLAGLVLALDDRLFGDAPLGYHLTSILLYVALVVAAGALYRRLLPGAAAVGALAVFTLSHAHVVAYAWIAAQHMLLGVLPATLALGAHVRARANGWRPGRWLAPVLLALGLGGSEAALGGVLFVLAYEAFGAAGTRRERLFSAAPALIFALAYALVYEWVGGGARGSGGYHDPVSDPLGFAAVAVSRVPILLGDALGGIPAELGLGDGVAPAHLALVGAAVVAFSALATWACWPRLEDAERGALRWLVPGALAATVLGVSGFPGGRVLLLPDLGFAALLGVLLRHGFSRAPRRPLRIACVAVLAIVHLGLAPLSALHATRRLAGHARATDTIAAELATTLPARARVFVIAASDPMVFLYPRGILAETAPGVVRCWSVLSAAHAPHRLTRTGERSFELAALGRPLLDGSFDTLFRAPGAAFAPDASIRQCGALVRVLAQVDGKPTRLAVDFMTRLDAPDLTLLEWRSGRLERFVPPAIGASVELPWRPGPSGIL
jgi:hypothetical protein